TNDEPGAFWRASIEEAAQRLAAILREESAEVLTIYDDYGNYGHPDHIQVYRVGMRAAELAGTPRVYQATSNRDHMRRGLELAVQMGAMPREAVPDVDAQEHLGKPEAEITAAVDVRPYLTAKRAAMRAHPSQIAEDSWFLAMPDEAFGHAF